MADNLENILNISYDGSGYEPCNKAYFHKNHNMCCPMTLYLLLNGHITNNTKYYEILDVAIGLFGRAIVYGYIDGFDGQVPKTSNGWGPDYGRGFGIGKQALLKFFG